MGRLASAALISLIVVWSGTLALAPAAEAVSSCINEGNVTAIGADGCDLGPLNFSNFVVSPTGVVANIFLGSLSNIEGINTNLTFQISHSPSPANLADIMLFYTVKTISGLATIGGVDISNPGHNVTIRETVCGTPFVSGVCQSGVLADNVAPDNTFKNATFTPLLSTVYLQKDIMLGPDSFISEFTNSHDEAPTSTPEPATLVLLGSSLAALGVVRRRSRKPHAMA